MSEPIEYTVKVYADGVRAWLLNGKLHRVDGLAYEDADMSEDSSVDDGTKDSYNYPNRGTGGRQCVTKLMWKVVEVPFNILPEDFFPEEVVRIAADTTQDLEVLATFQHKMHAEEWASMNNRVWDSGVLSVQINWGAGVSTE